MVGLVRRATLHDLHIGMQILDRHGRRFRVMAVNTGERARDTCEHAILHGDEVDGTFDIRVVNAEQILQFVSLTSGDSFAEAV